MKKYILLTTLLSFTLLCAGQNDEGGLVIKIYEEDCSQITLCLNRRYDPGARFKWIDIKNKTEKTTDKPLVQFDASFIDTEYECHVTFQGQRIDYANLLYKAYAVNADFECFLHDNPDNQLQSKIAGNHITASSRLVLDVEALIPQQKNNQSVYDFIWTSENQKDYGIEPRPFHFVKKGEYTLTLEVINQNSGCRKKTTKNITIQDLDLWVPNYFTPFSSFGKNDAFQVKYKSVAKFEMLIYNSMGKLIYKSKNPTKGWDGRINGEKAEPGVYTYVISAVGHDPKERKKIDGLVHLVITDN